MASSTLPELLLLLRTRPMFEAVILPSWWVSLLVICLLWCDGCKPSFATFCALEPRLEHLCHCSAQALVRYSWCSSVGLQYCWELELGERHDLFRVVHITYIRKAATRMATLSVVDWTEAQPSCCRKFQQGNLGHNRIAFSPLEAITHGSYKSRRGCFDRLFPFPLRS